MSRCRKCHRPLRDPEIMKIGYGKTCYKKLFGKAIKIKSPHRFKIHEVGEVLLPEGQMTIFDKEVTEENEEMA